MNAFLTFVTHDWYFAIPMFLMSLAGLTLVIWRLLLNYNGSVSMDEFLPAFQQRLEKEGVEGALRYCKGRTEIIPRRLYVAGLEANKQGLAAVRRAMANAIELEILPDLNFLLPPILAIAKIATMVGLLGTVISMIGTFTAIQEAAQAAARAASPARPAPSASPCSPRRWASSPPSRWSSRTSCSRRGSAASSCA